MLHKLGFHLPADLGKVYPRIPHFWSADHIFTVASKVGPINREHLKFSTDELEKISKKYSDTEKMAEKGKGEKLKPSRSSIDGIQTNIDSHVKFGNSKPRNSFSEDMDLMGNMVN